VYAGAAAAPVMADILDDSPENTGSLTGHILRQGEPDTATGTNTTRVVVIMLVALAVVVVVMVIAVS
jgi:hypothetical protein